VFREKALQTYGHDIKPQTTAVQYSENSYNTYNATWDSRATNEAYAYPLRLTSNAQVLCATVYVRNGPRCVLTYCYLIDGLEFIQ
jgi:hypothetical protein